MSDEDELARRRLEREGHPSAMDRLPDLPPMQLTEDHSLDVNELPSVVRARLAALEGIVAEVADELEQRGVDDLAERLRGALP
jgi:hypothetical protein